MIISRFFAIAGAVVFSTGCGSLSGQRGDGLAQILNPAPRETVNQDRIDSDANLSSTIARGKIELTSIAKEGQYVSALQASSRAPSDSTAALLFLRSGLALSDEVCSAWLRRLGEAQTNIAVERDFLGSVGLLAATILGVVDAKQRAIAVTAAGFEFTRNVITSHEANFIVAPSVAQVQNSIDLLRRDKRQIILTRAPTLSPYTYWDARTDLIEYDNTCSHLSIRRIVTAALARPVGVDSAEKYAEVAEAARRTANEAKLAAAGALKAAQEIQDESAKEKARKAAELAAAAAKEAEQQAKNAETKADSARQAKSREVSATNDAASAAAAASRAANLAKEASVVATEAVRPPKEPASVPSAVEPPKNPEAPKPGAVQPK